MFDHQRTVAELPCTRFDKQNAERILLGLGSTRIAVDEDGTAREMTPAEYPSEAELAVVKGCISEARDYFDFKENTDAALVD